MRSRKKPKIMLKKEVFQAGEMWWFEGILDLHTS